MSTDNKRTERPEPRQRRPYATPRVTRLGDVATLTRMPKSLGATEIGLRVCIGAPSTC